MVIIMYKVTLNPRVQPISIKNRNGMTGKPYTTIIASTLEGFDGEEWPNNIMMVKFDGTDNLAVFDFELLKSLDTNAFGFKRRPEYYEEIFDGIMWLHSSEARP